jgi:starch synthase
MERSLKICFCASEAAPLAKTGGLADVAAALPASLLRLGHDVRLFVPFYSSIKDKTKELGLDLSPLDSIRDIPVEIGWKTYTFTAHGVRLPETDLTVHLIDCAELYDRPEIYTDDDDEAQRFALFCRAVIDSCQRMSWAPHVFHCNDWHTALIPFLLRTVYSWDGLFQNSRSLVTIHNIGYQGNFPSSLVGGPGLDQWSPLLDQEDLNAGRLNLLRTGLIYAEAVSTVSPTYAEEIQTDEYGMGLQQVLRARRDTLVGILNGVDYAQWSPECDPFIPHRYSVDDLEGKGRNKLHLLERLGLESGLEPPLIGMITRLVHQKGIDLCLEVLPELLSGTNARLVTLGSGEERYEQFFEDLQLRFPGRVCYHRGYNDELAHVIEAASDMFLMPSRYEPCGLNQLFGLKYGTLPIVRRTGGLADSVTPVDAASGEGTGFVFEHFTADGLHWALTRALEIWQDQGLWRRLMSNAMGRNFSWEVQVHPYVELYRKIVERAA